MGPRLRMTLGYPVSLVQIGMNASEQEYPKPKTEIINRMCHVVGLVYASGDFFLMFNTANYYKILTGMSS
jgi:hypothetical protein